MWAYTADPVTSYEQWRNEAEMGWVFQCREPVLDFGRQAPGDLPGIFSCCAGCWSSPRRIWPGLRNRALGARRTLDAPG